MPAHYNLTEPKIVQINIGNSQNPIIYDALGMMRLAIVLGKIVQELHMYSFVSDIPNPMGWIVQHYHFHVDRRVYAFSGKTREVTVEDFSNTMIRVYNKKFPEELERVRYETIKTPQITFDKEVQNVLDEKWGHK